MSKFNAVGAGVKWGASKVKSIFTGGKQKTYGTGAIKSVPPSVPKTPVEKSLSKLKIQTQKTKGGTAKLKQTMWESETGEYKKAGFTFASDRGNVAKKSKKKDSRKWDQALKEYVKK